MRASYLPTIIPIVLGLFMATTSTNGNVHAVKFSFDSSTGESQQPANFGLPAALIGIASLAGVVLIINERKKSKGIWFSNSERLK
ncbi:MAG TPA: hypothetical protein VE199_00195 [Nitrososphaera sp.]|nr:hypothetical protein [Nitrososphaera sp.]